jgi:uncharacterized membrane protein
MWNIKAKAAWTLMALGALLVLLFSARYFTLDSEVYVESQRAVYEAHVVGLMIHISAMFVALALGPFQFLRSFRNRHLKLHRLTGKAYITGAMIGAVGGIYMSFYSIADAWSGVGFALLGIGVLITTGRAYFLIREGNVQEHREWMTRSFALILAAVTLRIYVPVLEGASMSEYNAFAIVGWASWLPNIIVAELLIRNQRGRREPSRLPTPTGGPAMPAGVG